MKTRDTILVLNCGSSSLKCAVWSRDRQCLFSALAEKLNTVDALVHLDGTDIAIPHGDHAASLEPILSALKAQNILSQITAVGHRVVHGGEQFQVATRMTDTVIAALVAISGLAPLHNPANITGIQVAQKTLPDIPHVAVFDTAFHQSMPAHAYHYAVPQRLYRDHGVRRYGFHGTSHRWVSEQALSLCQLDTNASGIITAHLGNGCSVTAIANGQSVDTSMGLTPLAGVVMGTRSGDVDPGLFSYLHNLPEGRGMSLDNIHNMLNKESGLLGLSESSNDMRTVLAAADAGDQQAQLAVDVFCYQLAKCILGLCAGLSRFDALIFTGGIGEHAAPIRQQTVQHLSLLGVRLSVERNQQHGRADQGKISTDDSVAVYVIPTNEELQIALDTLELLDN